jgi:hypothetical protein
MPVFNLEPEALADQRTINRLAPQAQLISFILLIALGPCFVAFGQAPASSQSANGKLASVIQLGEAIVKGTTTHSLSKSYVNSQKRPHFDLSQHLPVKERLGEYNASTAK